MTIKRQPFYPVTEIVDAVRQKVNECAAIGQPIDYLTFVPDGEPTLDANLAAEIQALRPFNIPIAVISNATLLHHQEVREALQKADWVLAESGQRQRSRLAQDQPPARSP